MLKCLTNLVLMIDLPPPGRPIAAKKKISTTCLNSNSAMSYHPLWSNHCLISSSAGCAPYISFLGILKSSTRIKAFLLFSGPRTPSLRRLSFGPKQLWSAVTFVRALNVIERLEYLLMFKLESNLSQFIDLPVPVPPQFNTCKLESIKS